MFYNFIIKLGKRKKKMISFWGKKTREKLNSAIIMISVDKKGQFFQLSWNYEGSRFNKHIKETILKKA